MLGKNKKKDALNQKILDEVREIKETITVKTEQEDKSNKKEKNNNPDLPAQVKTLLDLCKKKYFYLLSSAFFALLFSYTIYFDLYQYDRFLQKINPKAGKMSENNEDIEKLKENKKIIKADLKESKRQKQVYVKKINSLTKILNKFTIDKYLNKDKIKTVNCVNLKEKHLDELLKFEKKNRNNDLYDMNKDLSGKHLWLYNRCRKKILLKILDNVIFNNKKIKRTRKALLIHQSLTNELNETKQHLSALVNNIQSYATKINDSNYMLEEKNDKIEKLKKEKNDYFKDQKGILQIIEKSASFHGVSIPRIVLMPILPFTVLVFYIWFLVHFSRIKTLLIREDEDLYPIEFPWFIIYDTKTARVLAFFSFFIPFFIACSSCYLHYYVYNNYMDTIKLLVKVFPGYVLIICAIPVLLTGFFTVWTINIWRRVIMRKNYT